VHAFRVLQSHLLAKYQDIERTLVAAAHDDGATLSYRVMTVRYGIHRCRALLTWCDETLVTLRHLALPLENGTVRRARFSSREKE
ncbi:MAG: hypothetical protein ACR2PL_28500, partial [Dehalococcoidia bacterium]